MRAGSQQVSDFGRGVKYVLEVVEREQHPFISQVTQEHVARGRASRFRQPEGPNDARQDQGWISQRGKGHECHTMPEVFRRVVRRPNGQARLAHPADTREHQKTPFRTVQEIQYLPEIPLPSQKWRRRR